MVNLNVNVKVISEHFSVEELLDLIEWKVRSIQSEMPGQIYVEVVGHSVESNDR
jgi:hypothetical protein